jgi:hypothetical protein
LSDCGKTGLVLRSLALHDRLLKGIDVSRVVIALPEAGPINRGDNLAVVVDPLPAPGESAAEVVEGRK